jgi:hypothetical protein
MGQRLVLKEGEGSWLGGVLDASHGKGSRISRDSSGRRQKKTEILARVVGLRGRWASSGQVKDGLLCFDTFFF